MPAGAIEGLEARTLLSSSLSGGVLTVTGTAAGESITISDQGLNVKVTEPGGSTNFLKSAVQSIHVDGLGGNDIITLAGLLIPSVIDGGAGNDDITGSSAADTINGGDDHDTLHGGPGNDTINGGLGDDVIDGGDDNDIIDGGFGFYVFQGADGNDTLMGGSGNDELYGEDGTDTLRGGTGADMLNGGDGPGDVADYSDRTADLFITQDGEPDDGEAGEGDRVRLNIEVIIGGSGNDTIRAGELDETIYGGLGNDIIDGWEGNDIVYGQEGDDQLFGGEQDDIVYGGEGDDTISGGENLPGEIYEAEFGPVYGLGGFDQLFGEDGNDNINGGDSDDIIEGGNDDDFLYGSQGNDTIRGGPGNDTLIGGTEDDTLVGGEGDDLFSGMTGIDTADYSDHDAINAGPHTFVYVLLDDVANDGLYTDDGGTEVEFDNVMSDVENVIGTNGRDGMLGSPAANRLDGRGGDDFIYGEAGNDTLLGGQGDDELWGGNGSDSAPDDVFYLQTNLVSNNKAKYNSELEDTHLLDAWGLAFKRTGSGGSFWVSNAADGSSTTYAGDVPGNPIHKGANNVFVMPPPAGSPSDATSVPTGQVYNGGSDLPGQSMEFATPGIDGNGNPTTGAARFIVATVDGTVGAWRGSLSAFATKIDNSGEDSPPQYFGIAITSQAWTYNAADPNTYKKGNHIFLADFANQRIQTYDNQWHDVSADFAFAQPAGVPANYSPWNIELVDGKLYVEYAQVQTLGIEQHGPGLGYIARFNTDGTLDTLFTDHRGLNAPWGITKAPADFGPYSNNLLVANFGDGTIAALDAETGEFIDLLRTPEGQPISVEGIWALAFGNGVSLGTANHLYFTAGPRGEVDGIFGKLQLGSAIGDSDVLDGGSGADEMHGETGGDYFLNLDNEGDSIDGGADTDAMEQENLDDAVNVENAVPPAVLAPFPTPLPAAEPAGGLIYHGSVSGAVNSLPGGKLAYTINLDASQHVTVVAHPTSGLQPTVSLSGPGLNNVSVTATATGQDAVLQSITAAQSGTYTITISAGDSGGGTASVDLWLNAAVESESHNGSDNGTRATAQDLNGAFNALGGNVSHAAVAGEIANTFTHDYYSLSLTALQPTSFVLAGGTLVFELQDSNGALLATSAAGPANFTSAIANYTPASTGTYYLHVIGKPGTTLYNLLITKNVSFDAESNNSVAAAQSINAAHAVLGHTDAADADYYSLTVAQGHSLHFDLTFPGGGPNEPLNAPGSSQVDLYTSAGVLVASDIMNNSPAGTVRYLAAGTYVAKVSTASAASYLLQATDIAPAAAVVGRHIFYNNSYFDTQPGKTNDDAIAPETGPGAKAALLPGQTATFANYTSYSKGINGIMVDIANLPSGAGPVASDFEFRVGNDSTPAAWALLGIDPAITVRRGAGVNGSDRIELTWADGTIKKKWLRVKVKGAANTDLAAGDDLFYYGNAIGESGNSAGNTNVDATDELAVRAHPHGLFPSATPINSAWDFNRDGQVNSTDELLVRGNPAGFGTSLKLIVI